jgi:hypothetical protein
VNLAKFIHESIMFGMSSVIGFATLNVMQGAYPMVKEDEMGRACSTNGEKRNAYRILVGKPEGKRPLGRPRRRSWTTLKWMLERWDGMVWTCSIWLRVETSGGLL